MINQRIWIGIAVGVFFAGLGIGYAVLQSTQIMPMMSPQQMQKMMNDPQFMTQWHNSMMQNPQFMNRWMGQMMNDPNFQQQYMGPWMMMRDPQFMQNMMNQYSQQTNSKELAVKTNNVSILAETWQYESTKSYSPVVIEVPVGTTVTWTNDDVIIHTVTDLGGKFDSGFIQPDETWKHTFDSAGTYYYYCSIHPWMKGVVIALVQLTD